MQAEGTNRVVCIILTISVGLAVMIFNIWLSFVNLGFRWLSFTHALVRSRSRSTSVCNDPHYGDALQKRRMPNLRKPPCGRDPDWGGCSRKALASGM